MSVVLQILETITRKKQKTINFRSASTTNRTNVEYLNKIDLLTIPVVIGSFLYLTPS